MYTRLKWAVINAGLRLLPLDKKIAFMILGTSYKNIEEKAVLTITTPIRKELIKALDAKPLKRSETVMVGQVEGEKVSLIRDTLGAPSTATALEALGRSQVSCVIRCDVCATLTEEIPVGSLVIPDQAFLSDGCSKEYLTVYKDVAKEHPEIHISENPEIPSVAHADKELYQKAFAHAKDTGLTIHTGKIWTTDALFCETPAQIEKWKGHGAKLLDMETSILYLLGNLMNIPVLSIMVVSDHPGSEKYDLMNSPSVSPNLETGVKTAAQFVKDLLPHLPSK